MQMMLPCFTIAINENVAYSCAVWLFNISFLTIGVAFPNVDICCAIIPSLFLGKPLGQYCFLYMIVFIYHNNANILILFYLW